VDGVLRQDKTGVAASCPQASSGGVKTGVASSGGMKTRTTTMKTGILRRDERDAIVN
jgi:hypothetical protein